MGNFVIKKDTNEEYYFNLVADNSQIILTSQKFPSKSLCFSVIETVRNSCPYDSYERNTTVNHKHYFLLKDSNGQIIGTSELYSSKATMENGIESVKKNGINRKVVEEEPYF